MYGMNPSRERKMWGRRGGKPRERKEAERKEAERGSERE